MCLRELCYYKYSHITQSAWVGGDEAANLGGIRLKLPPDLMQKHTANQTENWDVPKKRG